jgi:hypothetical protein
MRALACLTLVLFCASTPCFADTGGTRTIQDLYDDCTSQQDFRQLSCIRFISGVASVMFGVGVIAIGPNTTPDERLHLVPFGMCAQGEVSQGQMKQVFINWAEKGSVSV